jgi:hypothetical protein
MDVISKELGIRLSFGKTSEFPGVCVWLKPQTSIVTPLVSRNRELPVFGVHITTTKVHTV